VLAVGDEHPSDDSPWWLFRQLSLRVRANGGDSIPHVQAQWNAFQDRLLASAYEVAKEGKTLIAQGRGAEARQRLTGYMEENVEVMLKMVRQMLSNAEASTDIAAD
jgi:dipeptidase